MIYLYSTKQLFAIYLLSLHYTIYIFQFIINTTYLKQILTIDGI